MRRIRFAVTAAALVAVSVALVLGCGKGKKSTDPAVGPLELSSGNLAPSGSYSHRFFTSNAYPYHCSIHSGMTGIVIVSASAPASDSLQTIDITNAMAFEPNTVTIPVGGKVTWANISTVTHTVTSD
jgi:plastocyanin